MSDQDEAEQVCAWAIVTPAPSASAATFGEFLHVDLGPDGGSRPAHMSRGQLASRLRRQRHSQTAVAAAVGVSVGMVDVDPSRLPPRTATMLAGGAALRLTYLGDAGGFGAFMAAVASRCLLEHAEAQILVQSDATARQGLDLFRKTDFTEMRGDAT